MSPSFDRLISDSGRTSLLIGFGLVAKLGVDLAIAARFGLGEVTDAFFVAWTLPLLSEAILYPSAQLALVPLFVHELRLGGTSSAWRLFNSLFGAAALVSAVLVVIAFAAGPWLVTALAPGAAETRELTLSLFRLLVLGVLPVGPLAVMRAFLNSQRLYAAPAALELTRGAVVLGALLVGRSAGIEALAIGFVLASFVQFGLLAGVVVRRLGFGYRLVIDLTLLRSRQVGRVFAIPLADYSLLQPVLVLERILGSFLPAGSITAISYGHRIASAVGVALFGGLEVVALPPFATELAKGGAAAERARAALVRAVRLTFVIGTPIAASAWALRLPLTQLALQRGAFDHESTLLAAPVIGGYLLSLPLFGYWLLFRSYLFASSRASRALGLSCLGVSANVALAFALWPFFGAAGLAAAYVGGLLAFSLASPFVAEAPLRRLQLGAARLVARVALASGALAAAQYFMVWASCDLLSRVDGLSATTVLASALAVSGFIGLPLLLVLFGWVGVIEAGDLWKQLRSKGTPG